MSKLEFKASLELYYEKFFPYKEMHDWLCNNGMTPFPKREWSFTIDDIYIRYQSYADEKEWKEKVMKMIPHKMDIGSCFNVRPSEKDSAPVFIATKKEFVIDIDITDYDNVRLCGCKGADYCRKCWPLMNCATEVLSLLLNELFGVSKLLWIYSGRRGIHCWVNDESFLSMDTIGRSSVAEFLHLYVGNEKNVRALNVGARYHPSMIQVSEVFKICEDYFIRIFGKDMQIFNNQSNLNYFIRDVLSLSEDDVADRKLRDDILKVIEKVEGEEGIDDEEDEHTAEVARKIWEGVKSVFIKHKKKTLAIETVYSLVYPRLDINVSRHLNHLLKAPFCVHPKTKRVCVPIEPKVHKTYYPSEEDCPNLDGICNDEKRDLENLKKGIKYLKSYVRRLESKEDDLEF